MSLIIEGLSVARADGAQTLSTIDLEVGQGQSVALIGESGSGKTTLGLAILRLLPMGLKQVGGRITLNDVCLSSLSDDAMRAIRGRRVAMVFQDPQASFMPVCRIGAQAQAILRAHQRLSKAAMREKISARFIEVGLPEPEQIMAAWPHELSGGMRQRVLIALALLNDPEILIADEPTTALDAVHKAEILALLKRLQARRGLSLLLISHDHAAVDALCTQKILLRAGQIVERASADWQSGYALALANARPLLPETRARLPTLDDPAPVPKTARQALGENVLRVRGLKVRFGARGWFKPAPAPTLHGIDFELNAGEVLGVVGASGSGKTTLGRALVGLQAISGGELHWQRAAPDRLSRARRVQMVFQNPYASLNPSLTVGFALAQALRLHAPALTRPEREAEVLRWLNAVGLKAEHRLRHPAALSGGERQRVAIARALCVQPAVLVCDECTSALDVSVQAQILNLLKDLQAALGMALIFISHDLAVTGFLSDRIMVLERGALVESGPAASVLQSPQSAAAKALLAAVR